MIKAVEKDKFEDEAGNNYYFTASGGYQTITLHRDDKSVVFELDYRNAYRMFDFLEKSIQYIEREDE